MKVAMKLFAFRFTDYNVEQLDQVRDEMQAETLRTGWPRRITRTDVLRCLIEREWDRIKNAAWEKMKEELDGAPKKKPAKPKTNKRKSHERKT